MKAVIVSGGHIDREFVCGYLNHIHFSLTIAVDSGIEFFKTCGYLPDVIIGDFDSAREETLKFFEEKEKMDIIRLIPEKDDTDTEAAVRRAIERGADEIHILGATGNRIDHMLGNIELLGIGLQKQVQMFIADANNRIRMIDHGIKLQRTEQYGKYVSLIPFTNEVTGLTLTGMKYPLCNYTMKCFNSLGVSNEIQEETAEIAFDDGILLVIESSDESRK